MQILVKGLLSYIFSLKIRLGWCDLSYSHPIFFIIILTPLFIIIVMKIKNFKIFCN